MGGDGGASTEDWYIVLSETEGAFNEKVGA